MTGTMLRRPCQRERRGRWPTRIRIRHSTVWRTVIVLTAFSQLGALFAGWMGPMWPLTLIVNGTLYYHLFRSEAAAHPSGLTVRMSR